MALSLYDAASIARDSDFQLRVAMAAYRVAHEVVNEGDVEGHPLRLSFARTILSQDIMGFGRYATMVVAMPEVYQAEIARQQDISDEKIESYLEAMWNDLAGYQSATSGNHTPTIDPALAAPTMTVYQP